MIGLINHIKNQNKDFTSIIQSKNNIRLSYGDLTRKVEMYSEVIKSLSQRSLVFLSPANTLDSVLLYLSCLNIKYPLCLIESNDSNLFNLTDLYKPEILLLKNESHIPDQYIFHVNIPETNYFIAKLNLNKENPQDLHSDLFLLLQTSGSTGNPKFVRLSEKNIVSNAESIVKYLNLNQNEKSIQTLPMQYSYGLSLLNSHLICGATTVLTEHSFMMPDFWKEFDVFQCTSFAGVPFMYETLHKLKFNPLAHSSLKTMTQAGGALKKEIINYFYEYAMNSSFKFVVMYGQTEATARISYVPPEMLGKKIGSIGIPIPEGAMELKETTEDKDQKEIVYKGSNVMMGYAEKREDLAKGDELKGSLNTGDLAYIDEDGYFYITGRLKKFLKLYGKRINTQDLEEVLEKTFSTKFAIVGDDKQMMIYGEKIEMDTDLEKIRNFSAKHIGIPPVSVLVRGIDSLPMTESGKKNYNKLKI